jgi:hypothetical protein
LLTSSLVFQSASDPGFDIIKYQHSSKPSTLAASIFDTKVTDRMAFYDNVLNFITDRTNRMSARATVIIVALVCILLVDNILGFSFYYNKQRQLEQLKSITLLLKDTSITGTQEQILLNLNIKHLPDELSLIIFHLS